MEKLRSIGFFERVRREFEPDFKLISLHVNGTTFYCLNNYSPIVFDINHDSQMDNIMFTVKPLNRIRIQGRLYFDEHTAAANTKFSLSESRFTEDGRSYGVAGGQSRTDADGIFVYYLDEENEPLIYIIQVRHDILIAESKPVLLKPGERIEGLKFILKSLPE